MIMLERCASLCHVTLASHNCECAKLGELLTAVLADASAMRLILHLLLHGHATLGKHGAMKGSAVHNARYAGLMLLLSNVQVCFCTIMLMLASVLVSAGTFASQL